MMMYNKKGGANKSAADDFKMNILASYKLVQIFTGIFTKKYKVPTSYKRR